MVCKYCGKYVAPGNETCPACGAEMRSEDESERNPFQSQRRQPNQQPQVIINQSQPGYVEDYPSTFGWILRFVVTAIPIVGTIFMIVWACGGTSHPGVKTWARAQLILTILAIIGLIVFMLVTGTTWQSVWETILHRFGFK